MTSLAQVQPLGMIQVEAWSDPVAERDGHDPRSLYVETFWLPVLGPSTVLLLRHLTRRLESAGSRGSVWIDLAETSRALGLGERAGKHAPFIRTLSRCIDFEMAQMRGADRLAVRRLLPPLGRRHLARLSPALAIEHDRFLASQALGGANGEALRQRARQLALSLIDLGEDATATERQLLRWHFDPAMAKDSVTWAASERAGGREGDPADGRGDGPAEERDASQVGERTDERSEKVSYATTS